jgi:zinc transporter ZupT
MSIDTIKLLLTGSILVMGVGSVFAPRTLTGTPYIFSLGNMMASGVLLSAGLVHQLADSAATLNHPNQFPWAMFLCGLTFLAFMVLEESLHLLLGGEEVEDHHVPPPHHHDHEDKDPQPHDRLSHTFTLHEMMHGGKFMVPTTAHRHAQHHGKEPPKDNYVADETQRLVPPSHTEIGAPHSHGGSSCCSHLPTSCQTKLAERSRSSSSTSSDHINTHHHHQQRQFGSFLQSTKSHKEDPYQLQEHHHHDDHIDLHLHGSILASGILMMALSIHSILAGVSIGIDKDWNSLTGTAIAIVAHKSFEGFCLGSSMVNAKLHHRPYLIMGTLFSVATPLGILIGRLVLMEEEFSPDDGLGGGGMTIAVVQAVVAGTFLYIAIVEIGTKELLACRHELSPHDDDDVDEHKGEKGSTRTNLKARKIRLEGAKLVCFVMGFLAMSALAALV